MDPAPKTLYLQVVRDEPLKPRQKRPVRAVVLHIARLAILAAILLLLRQQHQSYLAVEASRDQQPVEIQVLKDFFPDAVQGGLFDPDRRTQQVVDAASQSLGFVVQTSPQSDRIVGFSGPTNILIAFGTDDRILGLKILWSRDTVEHVDLIERHDKFLNCPERRSRAWRSLSRSPLASAAAFHRCVFRKKFSCLKSPKNSRLPPDLPPIRAALPCIGS
jgi:hypothetical protein